MNMDGITQLFLGIPVESKSESGLVFIAIYLISVLKGSLYYLGGFLYDGIINLVLMV